jgi:hypothetical protein
VKKIGQRDFGGRDQKRIFSVASVGCGSNGEQVFLEFGKLRGSFQGGTSDDKGDTDFGVSMFG